MNKQLEDKLFDDILYQAFEDDLKSELTALPSDEELSAVYSPSSHLERRIKKLYRHTSKTAVQVCKRCVVMLLLICSLTFGICMLSPDVRASVKKVFMSVFGTHVTLYFETEEIPIGLYTMNYIPKGYELKEQFEMAEAGIYTYDFVDTHGNTFIIEYAAVDGTAGIDNERHDIIQVKIGEYDGIYAESKKDREYAVLIWSDKVNQFTLRAMLPMNEMIKIAEKIR